MSTEVSDEKTVVKDKGTSKMKIWLRAVRAPFLTATVIPAVLGSVIAWYQYGVFYWYLFFAALIGAVLLQAGTNLANDYFDHLSEADEKNLSPTPFSGGSRIIQDGALSPREVLLGTWVCYGLSAIIGIYLTIARGLPIIFLGIAAIFIGLFYTAGPFKFGYRGLGEIAVGMGFGPLLVLGCYFVQTQHFGSEPFYAALPVGLLIAAVLYINEFPDRTSDEAAGKRHLVVKLGPDRAIYGYYILLALTYIVIVVGVLFEILPVFALLALFTLPLANKAFGIARVHYKHPTEIIPAMAMTIQLHSITGLLLSGGYIISSLVLK